MLRVLTASRRTTVFRFKGDITDSFIISTADLRRNRIGAIRCKFSRQKASVKTGPAEDAEAAAEQNTLTEPVTGSCGEKLLWKLDIDGTLTISGSGAMTAAP